MSKRSSAPQRAIDRTRRVAACPCTRASAVECMAVRYDARYGVRTSTSAAVKDYANTESLVALIGGCACRCHVAENGGVVAPGDWRPVLASTQKGVK